MKNITYPNILQCCVHAKDKFWFNVFESLSYSKCPPGTYIINDSLCCSYKKKEFNYSLVQYEKSTKTIYEEIHNLLSKKIGLQSKDDRYKKYSAFKELQNKIFNEKKTWPQIRRKNIKDIHTENFVLTMKNKYNFTIKQCRKLLSVIFMATVFKIIKPEDVLFDGHKIVNINGFDFKDSIFFFNKSGLINSSDISSNAVEKNKKKRKKIMDMWKKKNT
jgi:hypothetical protein